MASLFAARLSSLTEVYMIGSWQRQIEVIREKGLTLIGSDGSKTVHEVQITNILRETRKADLSLIMVKTWQTSEAAQKAGKLLKPRGLALTLQNGIGNHDKIASEVGEKRALIGSTSEGANMILPGIVRHAGKGLTHIAQGATPGLVQDLVELLSEAQFETHIVADVDSLIWGKLAINAGINPLTGLLQVRNGFLAEDPIARDLMERAAQETELLAIAQGIRLPYPSAAVRTLEVAQMTAANVSSMAHDVLRGTPTEIESITGPIVSIGSEIGIETPVNATLLQLMRTLLNEGDWLPSIGQLPKDLRPKFSYLATMEPNNEYTITN